MLKYEHPPYKPRPVSFWLYFPNENNAELAKIVLEKDGFDADIFPPSDDPDIDDSDWLCIAYKTMIPEYEELSELRKWLVNVAAELSGIYDGWESVIIQ